MQALRLLSICARQIFRISPFEGLTFYLQAFALSILPFGLSPGSPPDLSLDPSALGPGALPFYFSIAPQSGKINQPAPALTPALTEINFQKPENMIYYGA